MCHDAVSRPASSPVSLSLSLSSVSVSVPVPLPLPLPVPVLVSVSVCVRISVYVRVCMCANGWLGGFVTKQHCGWVGVSQCCLALCVGWQASVRVCMCLCAGVSRYLLVAYVHMYTRVCILTLPYTHGTAREFHNYLRMRVCVCIFKYVCVCTCV